MGRRAWHRTAAAAPWAVVGSVAAHLAAVGVALVALPASPPGAVSAGLSGLEIMVGPAGAAAGAEPPKVEEVVETEEPVEELPLDFEPPPAPPLAEEPAEVVTSTAEVAEAVVEEKPAEPEKLEEEKPVEPPKIEPIEPPKPRPKVQARPKPKPVIRRETPPEPKQLAALPGALGKAGSQTVPDAGSGQDSQGGGVPGAPADYLARLRAWLERHKEYPRGAQLRRLQGTVLVQFVMNRQGNVLSSRITRSSGHEQLDRAVEAMLRRAQPLPQMPPDMPQSELQLMVPIQFYMR